MKMSRTHYHVEYHIFNFGIELQISVKSTLESLSIYTIYYRCVFMYVDLRKYSIWAIIFQYKGQSIIINTSMEKCWLDNNTPVSNYLFYNLVPFINNKLTCCCACGRRFIASWLIIHKILFTQIAFEIITGPEIQSFSF